MSAVCVLTPMLIGAWPAIASAIGGVAATLGFTISSTASSRGETGIGCSSSNSVETDFPNSEILSDRVGDQESMRIEKDGVSIEFRRDERGACSLCVSGSRSKAELKKISEEIAGRVTQQFAYNKLITELKKHNYSTVEEQVQQDDSIRVRVRFNG